MSAQRKRQSFAMPGEGHRDQWSACGGRLEVACTRSATADGLRSVVGVSFLGTIDRSSGPERVRDEATTLRMVARHLEAIASEVESTTRLRPV